MKRLVLLLGGVLTVGFAARLSFSGSTSAQTEYTIRQGVELDREPFAWTLRLSPTLTLWKVPLSFGFMLSSYDVVDYRQPFNRFGLSAASFGFQGLKFSAPWLGIEILDARPSYSSLTLSGINVRGAAIDLKPGWFRLSAAAGQVQRGVTGSDSTDVAYRRWLAAGRLGVGKDEESHLHLHFLKAWDDSASIPPYLGIVTDGGQTDTVELEYPIENSVASLEGKLFLIDGKLSFDGELAGSAYNRDMRTAEVETDLLSWLPSVIFQPRLTSQADWAAKAGTELSLGNTQVGFNFEQIGWGFESVGISFVNQDTRTWGASFSHMFAKPFPISFDLSSELGRDNLDGMKSVITRTQGGTVNFGLYPQKSPNLTVGYSPFLRKAPEDTATLVEEVDDITHSAWASSSFSFSIGERSQSLNLAFSLSLLDDQINPDREFLNWSTTFSGRHQIIEILSAHWSGGTSSNRGADTVTIYNAGLGSTLSLWQNRWRTSLDGFSNITAGSPENKFTLRLQSGVEVFKNFNIDLTGQFITYHGETNPEDYTELLGRVGVSYRW